jgi:hypothetical protein
MTGLRLAGDRLTFYIKPANGLGLPDILKWMKQTFAVRYNRLTGRIGHIWGDRYWSAILEGEPPEGAEWEAGEESAAEPEAGPKARVKGGMRNRVRPRHEKTAIPTGFPPLFSHPSPSPPP